jgi:hypothetical protein
LTKGERGVLPPAPRASLTVFTLRAVLVGLYEEPERPPQAVEYVKKYMGAPVGVDVDGESEQRWEESEEPR